MVAAAEEQTPGSAALLLPSRSWWRSCLRLARRKTLGAVGVVIILIFLFVAIFGPGIAVGGKQIIPGFTTQDPNKTSLTQRLKPPTAEHLFGTDELGRDVFTRTVYGVRPSIVVGLL